MLENENHPFWQFSVDIYRSAIVEENLLKLQDEHALNINLLLYCCWYALCDQRVLSKVSLQEILIQIQPWHEHIVLPLRKLAKSLKSQSAGDWPSIRQAVLKESLFSEQVEQYKIAEKMIFPPKSTRNPKQRMNDSAKNIFTYCRLVHVHLDAKDCHRIACILHVIFPQIDQEAILSYCIQLAGKDLQSIALTSQLALDLS